MVITRQGQGVTQTGWCPAGMAKSIIHHLQLMAVSHQHHMGHEHPGFGNVSLLMCLPSHGCVSSLPAHPSSPLH